MSLSLIFERTTYGRSQKSVQTRGQRGAFFLTNYLLCVKEYRTMARFVTSWCMYRLHRTYNHTAVDRGAPWISQPSTAYFPSLVPTLRDDLLLIVARRELFLHADSFPDQGQPLRTRNCDSSRFRRNRTTRVEMRCTLRMYEHG